MYNIEEILKISDMYLRSKLLLRGYLAGIHRVPYKGISAEFSQYREYVQGDDFSRLDFKVFLRTEKFFIKESENEINADIYLFLDISGSMSYNIKPEYSKTLFFLMAYIAFHQSDNCGYGFFSNRMHFFKKPTRKRTLLTKLIIDLNRIKFKGKTDIKNSIHYKAENIKKNSIIILISDCADDRKNISLTLKSLKVRGCDVILFHVNDFLEKDKNVLKNTRLKDIETGSIVSSDNLNSRLSDFNAFTESIKNDALDGGYDYVHLFTNEQPYTVLEEFFKRRK